MARGPVPELRNFQVLAALGRGSLGTTYQARRADSGDPVAVKLVAAPSEALRLRLKREVRALAQIHHPLIARVLDLVEDGANLLVVSEWVEGKDLLSGLQAPVDGGRTPVQNAVLAFAQLLKALAHLHGHDLVHGGLKPSNVLVTSDGGIKVVDGGLGRPWTLAQLECLPLEQSVAGAYLAPEQLAGRTADARLDLYQTGLLLYETLSGNRPHPGATLLAKLRSRVRENPVPLATREPGLAHSFGPLLERLLARSPEARHGSAAEVLSELREAWKRLEQDRAGNSANAPEQTVNLRSTPEAETAGREPDPDHGEVTQKMRRPYFAPTAGSEAPPAAPAAAATSADGRMAEALSRPVADAAPSLAAALVGRSGEIDRLERELFAACAGSGRLVALSGEAGIGKSRLIEEFAAEARLGGALVLAGHDDERRRARHVAIVTLLDAAARALGEMSEEERASCLPADASALAELSDGFRAFAAPSAALDDLETDARQRKHRRLAAITELLARLAARTPLVAVFEDLHTADAESVEMVEHLVGSLLDKAAGLRARFLPIVTYRNDEIDTEHPLARSLIALAEQGLLERVELDRLDRAGTARLLETMTGLSPAPPALVDHLQAETSGNPLYVVETVQLLRDERVLAPRAGQLEFAPRRLAELAVLRPGERATVASGVRESVKRRLVRLSAPALEALQLAAVAGHEIGFQHLRRATGRSEEEVLDALVELLHARVLVEPTERLATYRFDHDKTREVILSELSPRARRSLAGRIGNALEAGRDPGGSSQARELVALFEEAQAPEKVLAHLPAAAEAAARDGDVAGALRYLERLFEIDAREGDVAAELGARRLQARLLVMDGQLDRARTRYLELLQRAEGLRRAAEQVEALNGLSEVAWKTGDFAQARSRAEAALERAQALALRPGEAAALENLGVVHRRTYDVKAASRSLREALKLHRAQGDALAAARVLSSLGILFRNQDNYALAATHFREAHEAYQEHNDRLGIALTLSHLASVHARSNEFDRALELYQEASAIEQAMGNRRGVALCREGLGYVYLTEGDYARARDCFSGALEVFRRIGDRPNAAYSLINLGHTAFRDGGFAESAGFYREALALLEGIGNPVIESEARSGLALALDAEGDKKAALSEAVAAVEVARSRGAREKEAWAQHTLARVSGSLEEARRALELAESVQNENLMFMVHHQLAVLQLEHGEREPAREHFQRAFTLIDELAGRTGKAKEMFLRKPPVAAVFRDAARL